MVPVFGFIDFILPLVSAKKTLCDPKAGIKLPKKLTAINNRCFNGCTSLSTVEGLSSWCVENISQANPPMHFATNAPFANTASNLPNWGVSCDT